MLSDGNYNIIPYVEYKMWNKLQPLPKNKNKIKMDVGRLSRILCLNLFKTKFEPGFSVQKTSLILDVFLVCLNIRSG